MNREIHLDPSRPKHSVEFLLQTPSWFAKNSPSLNTRADFMEPRFSIRSRISSGFVKILAATMPSTNWSGRSCWLAGAIFRTCCCSSAVEPDLS